MSAPFLAKRSFIKSGEGSVASYNFSDILSGTGYATFYLGNLTTNLLSDVTYYSATTWTSYSVSDAAPSAKGTLNFDGYVNRPLTLSGKAIATIASYKSALQQSQIYFVVSVCKYSGTTETVLSSGTSSVNGPTDTETYKYLSCEIDVPLTTFKKGDYIRVKVVTWAGATQSSGICKIGHDPLSSTETTWTSTTVLKNSKIAIPFRIDL